MIDVPSGERSRHPQNKGGPTSQSLDRGLQALRAIAAGATSLNNLAVELDVHKSTVLRLLRTLEAHRLVARDAQHTYRLGSGLFALANQALESLNIRDAARPHLLELNTVFGHTVHLATYEEDEVIYIDKLDSKHSIRMYSRVGRLAPLHCTAVGKVLVADLPSAERQRIANSLSFPAMTSNTITSKEQYLDTLKEVTAQGFATDMAEHEDFVHCVATPVRDGTGDVVAAISMSIPIIMLDERGIERYRPALQRTAEALSSSLGA